MAEKLTQEQIEWFAERMDTAESGRVIVPTYLLDKYRKLTGDYKSHNQVIKSNLISECMNAGI